MSDQAPTPPPADGPTSSGSLHEPIDGTVAGPVPDALPADTNAHDELEPAAMVPDWDALAAADERTPGELLAALAELTRERDEYLDGLRRKQAEFDNYRKRMLRDGAGQRVLGHAEVAERLLDVLDDFDRTIANAADVEPGFLKGVTLVNDKLHGVLGDFGLRRIDGADVAFDPTRHEAVQQVPADEPVDEPVVHEVLRPGYELGEKVLRAAMVAVRQ